MKRKIEIFLAKKKLKWASPNYVSHWIEKINENVK